MDKEKYFDLTGWDGLWAFGPRNEGALLTQAGLLALKEVHGDFARVDFPNAEARHVFGELFGAG